MTRQKAILFLSFLVLVIPALPPALFPFFQPYTFGKTTLFEIIVEAMAVVWLVSRKNTSGLFRPVHTALFALAGILTLATIFSANASASFWGSSARMDGLFTLLHFAVFFIILASSFAKEQWYRCIRISVGAGTFAALYGIAQWFGAPFVVSSRGEIFGTLGNPSYLALYLLFTIFLAHYLAERESKRDVAVLLYCAGAIQIIALLLTQVQAALIALVVGIFVAVYPYARARITLRRGIAALAVMSALFLLFSFSTNFAKLASVPQGSASLSNRMAVWNIALSGIAEKPLLGHGANNFEPYYLAQKNAGDIPLPATGETFDKPHNAFLETAFSYGVIGLAAYLFFAGTILRRARAHPALRGALVGYLIFLFFFFDTFASFLMFFLIAALLFSLSSPEENDGIVLQKTVSPLALVAGGIALAVIFFTFHFKPLYSAYFARQFLIQTATAQVVDETLKAKALRHHAFNAPFIERAILLAERAIKK